MKDYKWTIFTVALLMGLLLALVCNPPKEETKVEPLTLLDLFPETAKKIQEPRPMNLKDVYMIYQMYFDEDLIALRLEMEEQEAIR